MGVMRQLSKMIDAPAAPNLLLPLTCERLLLQIFIYHTRAINNRGYNSKILFSIFKLSHKKEMKITL